MSNKELSRFSMLVQVPCPICRKPVKYQITFYGMPLNQKKGQTIILDCPACGGKELGMHVNIDKKIEQLEKKIIYTYTKTGDNGDEVITGELYGQFHHAAEAGP